MKKTFISIILVLIMALESFAATVSDNDGSAFITKAEFDSLKNNFQSQIDQFNSSIDSKIDAAIAAYLAGIKVSTEQTIISLLDSEGKYGGFLEYWCSDTTKAYDRVVNKYSRDTFSVVHNAGRYSMMVKYEEPKLKSWSADEKDFDQSRDYYTSKKTAITLDDGTQIENALNRMKINTKMSMSQYEQKVGITAAGAGGDAIDNTAYVWNPQSLTAAMDNNGKDVHQGMLNVECFSSGTYRDFASYPVSGRDNYINVNGNTQQVIFGMNDYIGYGIISTLTNEVTKYEYDKYNVNYPLSNIDDLYWDAEDLTSYPASSDKSLINNDTIENYDTCVTLTRDIWGVGALQWNSIGPGVYTKNTTPWCSKTGIKARDEYLVHWNTASNKNRQVKNGMYIGSTSSKGKLKIDATATANGTLYVWLGEQGKYIDDWTSSSFEGSRFNLSAGTPTVCEISNAEKDRNIWIIYLPTSTSDKAVLKINSIIMSVDAS